MGYYVHPAGVDNIEWLEQNAIWKSSPLEYARKRAWDMPLNVNHLAIFDIGCFPVVLLGRDTPGVGYDVEEYMRFVGYDCNENRKMVVYAIPRELIFYLFPELNK